MNKEELEEKLIPFRAVVSVIGAPLLTVMTGDPFVSSAATNLFLETFFGIRSELKMQRITKFLEKLEQGIREIDKEFNLDEERKIELQDLIETAILKAAKTSSEQKYERLKSVIRNHLLEPIEYDYSNRFLELVERLNDKQVKVLQVYVETEQEMEKIRAELKSLHEVKTNLEKRILNHDTSPKDSMYSIKKKLENIERDIQSLGSIYTEPVEKRKNVIRIFAEDERQFMLLDLRSSGLIYNPSEGKSSNTGEFAYFWPTGLAKKFIEYLS